MQEENKKLEDTKSADSISAKIDQALSEADADSSQKDESSTHRAGSTETGKRSEDVIARKPVARWSDFVPSSSIGFLSIFIVASGYILSLVSESGNMAAGFVMLFIMILGFPLLAIISAISLVSVPIYLLRHRTDTYIKVTCLASLLVGIAFLVFFFGVFLR